MTEIDWEHIEDLSSGYTGEAHHIRLSEAVEVQELLGDGVKTETADFIVSATTSLGTPETYAFPADEDGEVTSWGEVCGAGDMLVSQKNLHDWERVADELAEVAATEGLLA